MTRRVALYLVGSVVLVSLAGCGRGFFQTAEREPWRAEAEAACLKSGEVKESAELVRIRPISGPGVCGAEFPLKVSAFGESPVYGFANEDLRPPASVGRNQPRWPVAQPSYPAAARQSAYGSGPSGPVSLNAPGVHPVEDRIELPPDGTPDAARVSSYPSDDPYAQPHPGSQSRPYGGERSTAYPATPGVGSSQQNSPLPRLGPARGTITNAVGAVAVKPAATLACPIVSALDRWLADAVQPAAMRWFGARVAEIKQISAYSCRGMNGNPHAHISEHAFGNALDIAGFTLADGRYVSVQHGWKGLPEEQGFLRDVEASACQRFTTVLAPGSNVHHYNHIHVDLMRRASRRVVCKPAAVSGEEIAARAARGSYAGREPAVTGSLGGSKSHSHSHGASEADYDE
ncbi:Extensin-like protein [Nitrobacter hamburgensis X14]|uniref:Extensin-like protein n=1 Tax=Nitrobacter hamburgensis (strain DSM 10229 / NCIMB 13809 / X14) TaxID=323097 RepID=Q1QJE4_NITHX|nr:extensin family protein [Nitrobacter hamburgensis]ABE63653.1 Extensin-like protein [Nitrobacter hamburgensis X14]